MLVSQFLDQVFLRRPNLLGKRCDLLSAELKNAAIRPSFFYASLEKKNSLRVRRRMDGLHSKLEVQGFCHFLLERKDAPPAKIAWQNFPHLSRHLFCLSKQDDFQQLVIPLKRVQELLSLSFPFHLLFRILAPFGVVILFFLVQETEKKASRK